MKDIHSAVNQVAKQIKDAEVRPQMCFCRKYRANGNTKYIFYRANIFEDVANEFKNWLTNHINSLKDKDIKEMSGYTEGYLHSVDLDNISTWKYFEDNAFSIGCQELIDLKSIKRNLNNYVIYIKLNDTLVGYTTCVRPSNVLVKRGFVRLQFNNSTFNQINNNKDVEINKLCSFLFISNNTLKKGLIFNKDDFESIFDMNEQYQREAEHIIRTSNIFQFFTNKEKILEIVKSDRVIQKMLRNPVSQKSISEIKIEDISIIKECLCDDVNFTIDKENNIVLGENEKAAVRDLIKAIGHHFNKTIYGNNIIESSPKRFLR